MGFSKKASIFATALLAAVANGHMLLRTPTPYGKSTLNNGPLDPSGSDFPCKLRAGAFDKEGAQNVMAIGESQTLSFTGSAVHGGGSCQVALTTDLAPTKDSKWMVIKSIVGGCPANVPGNLSPADPNGNGASTFQYSIPAGIAPGEYTLSWSWFNKVGNREYYQNCAPVTVTGAKRKRYQPAPKPEKRQTSFPGLAVANLASVNDCQTPENFEVAFANPGPDVQTAGDGAYTTIDCQVGGGGGGAAPQQPTQSPSSPAGGNPGATASPTATASGAHGEPNGGGHQSGSGKPTYGYPLSSPAASASPGAFADGASSVSVNVVTPVTTDAAATSTPEPDSRSGGNNTGSSSSGQTGACTEGAWNCLDGTSFQRCASGSWSATIQMAAGMKCVPGISANFVQSAGNVKRHSHGGHFRFFNSFH